MQFETIHPFLNGNGRVGRLLITFYLCLLSLPFISASAASAGGILQNPVLCLSHYFKKHRADYYDNLQAVRDTGDWERGLIFLLRGVIEFRGGGHGASGVSGRIEA